MIKKPEEETAKPSEADELFCAVLEELRTYAHRLMIGQSPHHTLQPTALVNEVYLRLSSGELRWPTRAQFLWHASLAMRSILVDHARAKRAKKRRPTQLECVYEYFCSQSLDVLDLEDALLELYDKAPIAAKVVEMRYFAGASIEEVGVALQLSTRTVDRKWQFARAFLRDVLADD